MVGANRAMQRIAGQFLDILESRAEAAALGNNQSPPPLPGPASVVAANAAGVSMRAAPAP